MSNTRKDPFQFEKWKFRNGQPVRDYDHITLVANNSIYSLFWNPSSEAIDALTQNWSGKNNFLVPPIYSKVPKNIFLL
jgi:hypothetical protein